MAQPLLRRSFQSSTEYQQWLDQIQASRMPESVQSLVPLNLEEHAPLLYDVSPMADHLEIAGFDSSVVGEHTPRASLLQCRYPLEHDELLRKSITDLNNWSSFRLGKYYDTLDILTGDAGARYFGRKGNDPDTDITLVTAGHYHSRKMHRTDIYRDLWLRSYVTAVGMSSVEIRTDVLQKRNGSGDDEILVNVCHTAMVALDKETLLPLSKAGKNQTLPPLQLVTPDDHARVALAQQHQEIRRQRSASAMQLRAPVSVPPSADEMRALHKLHQTITLRKEAAARDRNAAASDSRNDCVRVADFTFHSSRVIFPEKRNVNGELFGGFVLEEAQNLAQYTASMFARGQPVLPVGIDEAIFLQPIAIGDLVTFTARLVHSTPSTCRVLVTVEVRDAADPDRVPLRSNRLLFVFCGGGNGNDDFRVVVPDRYGEVLMYMDAQRRYQVEGPTDEHVQLILEESAAAAASRQA